MMDSMILSLICAFCAWLSESFKKSATCRVLLKIYNAISGWWQDSIIMSFLKKEQFECASENSLLHKLVRIPFAFFGLFKKDDFIKRQIENSFLVDFAKAYTNSALALNTKFYGCILLSMLTVREIMTHSVSLLVLVLAVLGIILVLLNYNITRFLGNSKLVKFCLSAVGFENITWEFYDSEIVVSVKTLVLAIISGAVMGVISLKSPIIALALPIAFVGMSVVLMYPVSGIFFAAAAAPFVPTMILAGICILTFFSLFVKSICDKSFKWNIDGVGTGLGFFLIFMLVSCIFSFSRTKSLMVWAMYLVFVGFYFVIINTVKTKEQLYSLLKVFAFVSAFVSIYGILQYIFGWNTKNAWIDKDMFEDATMRAYSTMENPNVLGEYLLLMIPIAALFMIKPSFKKLEKWFYIGTFLVNMLCMVFTQSRGCWLGLILSALIFVTFYNGKLWGILPIVILALPFVIPQTFIDRLMSIGNMEDSSTSYRVFIWLGTLKMMKDFWIGGIGMGEGAFRTVYPLYSYNSILAPHSHNTFLQLLTEGGVVALVTFIVIMLVFIKNMSKVYMKNGKKSMHGGLALAIGSGVIGFLLQSMFDYTFYNYRMMAMFFMIVALGMSLKYVGEVNAHEGN